jgi:hypothetical protein
VVYTGWASFAGTELINNSRTAIYSRGINLTCYLPELAASLGDDPYVSPADDDAPWSDQYRSESNQFYGLVGKEFLGADTASNAVQWTELLGDGGVPGAHRRSSREVEVKALAVAGSDAGMSYGLAWLASALRGSACTTGCYGDSFCVYAAPPTRPLLTDDSECPTIGVPDPDWDPIEGGSAPGGNALQRSLFNVAVIEGLEVTGKTRLGGGLVYEVRWTVKAGLPYWYSEPTLIARDTGQPGGDIYRDVLANYDPWSWQAGCPTATGCLDLDPYCDNGPAAPELAPTPPDPCFPSNPANNPVGQPNRHRFNARRAVIPIPGGSGPGWLEKVPTITVYTGQRDLHRLILRWYDNPKQLACGPSLDPCYACAEVNVPWLPKSVEFTLDGRTRRASVDCPGPGGLTEPRVYGPSGGAFEWPVFECSAPMCLEVLVDNDRAALDLTIDVQMSYREDAI